ncbi:TetR family transcriptional regulator [Microlunatus speluncae]|uniref:TetR/AcrR family transcriptional regulator n=1 Tax=Microlunatus speluncae TaxID=2594267 RepID=UPI00126681BE|nr:TetR family transcriptional regulator [Microlunatus speluncae]
MARGRRPGGPDTRQAVLEAARQRFAEAGYARATIRSIATQAGVDPSLVVHYFGSKEQLFRAVVDWPFDPAEFLDRLAAPGRAGLGRRLTEGFLGLWESAETGPRLQAVFRGAVTQEEFAGLIREFLLELVAARLAPMIGGDRPELRVELALGTLLGTAVVRHLLRVEPLAGAALEELVDQLAPVVERLLSGDSTVV